jgi:resuscitation-promoting factor RpfB
MAISAAAVAYCAVGGLVAYSGIKGATLSDTAQAVLKGNLSLSDTETVGAPATTGTGTAAAGNTGAESPSASSNQALAKQLATSMGFSSWTTGQEWSDWVSLWNQESGWSITAANPTSSARGIAQNIDGYGPDYLEGNATSQITWGINYIAQRYGSPALAWAHEVEDNWY